MGHATKLWVARYAVNPFDSPKSVEKWVARFWNVSEERVTNAQVKVNTKANIKQGNTNLL